MSNSPPRFVDWLVMRFHDAGMRFLYGVPGGGTSLDLIDAATRQGMQMVLTAREDAAVIMAGVAGVLAETPGLAFTTKGPGLSSSANGLASAKLDRMPVLLVTETFGEGERDYVTHQVFDQDALVRPLLPDGNAAILESNAETIEAWLDGQCSQAPGPAVIFPTAKSLAAPSPQTKRAASDAVAPSMDDVAEICERLAKSLRPVFVVGLEAARPALMNNLLALVSAYSAPALTTYMACGTVPHDHPCFAGIFTGGAIEQSLVAAADLIVLLGLDPVELIRKPWTYDAPVLDISEKIHAPHYVTPAARATGPLQAVIPQLLEQASTYPSAGTWSANDIEQHRERFYTGLEMPERDNLSAEVVVRLAADCYGPRRRLTIDAGAHMFSASTYWPAREARDILISNGLASMGFAIPAGIAAALHDPERGAVAMTGDGGALMCLGELRTAATVNAKLCIIIFNDGCLSLIDIKREERQLPDLGLSWPRPDFAAIARGFGIKSWRADTPEAFSRCCAEAALEDGPCLIDAHIDAQGYPTQMRALRG